MKPKIAHTVFEWENLCLSVERQFQRFQVCRYRLQTVSEIPPFMFDPSVVRESRIRFLPRGLRRRFVRSH